MKRLGSVLMAIGALLGMSLGVGVLAGVSVPGVSWFIAVGLVKLALLAAIGFLGAGASLIRLAKRAEKRASLPEPS